MASLLTVPNGDSIYDRTRAASFAVNPEIQRRMSLLSSESIQSSPRSYSPGPRLSMGSESGEVLQRSATLIAKAATATQVSTSRSLEALARELHSITTDNLVTNAAALKRRLAQVPDVLREFIDILDDARMAKPLARLHHALGQIRSTLQSAKSSSWFRRRSRFRQPVRLAIDDLGDAIANVRIAATQISTVMCLPAGSGAPRTLADLGETASPPTIVVGAATSRSEFAFLMGDRFYFGTAFAERNGAPSYPNVT